MKFNKGEQILQVKTGNRQLSDTDLFSKLEINFLEKFFKYNLTDYFSQIFTNLYQDYFDRKINLKEEKNLAFSLFIANTPINVEELEKNINQFYRSKSKSIIDKTLPFAFRKTYCWPEGHHNFIGQGELIFVDVKMKAQVKKIEQAPQKLLYALENFKFHANKNSQSQLQRIFSKYKSQYFNIFFIYFGDINFQIFNKKKFEVDYIRIMGRNYKVRIFVFFVSKQGMIQSFRTLNKLENLEYINDLVIQFYELKREKQRRKRVKQNNGILFNSSSPSFGHKIQVNVLVLGVVGIVGLITFGFAMKKLFF